jgi:hypothetical protein
MVHKHALVVMLLGQEQNEKCTYFCEHGLPMLGDHGGLVAVEGDRGLVEGLFGMP